MGYANNSLLFAISVDEARSDSADNVAHAVAATFDQIRQDTEFNLLKKLTNSFLTFTT